MRPWARKKQVTVFPSGVPCIDIGVAECPRCTVVRTLYRPINRLDLYLCAPCTQLGSLRALTDVDRQESQESEAA